MLGGDAAAASAVPAPNARRRPWLLFRGALRRRAQGAGPATANRLQREPPGWSARRAEIDEDTLAVALHAVIEGVEAEQSVAIDATVLGDRPLDDRGEALAAATREALRNAARHAPGSPIVVFAELGADGSGVYVRDEGPGFDPGAVPLRHRGVRDSILTRMASVGGSATVESTAGEGTEVALRLPAAGRASR